jgi:hypothetical protein
LQTAAVQNATDEVSWDDVTIGELASHMAGIGRDCKSFFKLIPTKFMRINGTIQSYVWGYQCRRSSFNGIWVPDYSCQ